MDNYHLRIETFHPKVLEATDRLFRSRPWSGTRAQRDRKYVRWIARASNAYKIEVPGFSSLPDPVDPDLDIAAGACYNFIERKIYLPQRSVTTLFHEFRHHVQFERGLPMTEDDARAWSQSLYYQVRPARYLRAVEEGKILFP